MSIANDVYIFSVRNRSMFITHRRQSLVDSEFIGEDLRTFQNAISDNRKNGLAAYIPDFAGREFPAALYHSEYSRLIQSPASSDTFASAAEVGLIYFYVAAKDVIGLGKHGTDLLAHAPSRLIGNAGLALNLLRRNAAASLRHEINDVEPNSQWSGRLVEDRASSWGKMITTVIAGIGFLAVVVM